jgi:hypothetical protein
VKSRRAVLATANFERNLEMVEEFLAKEKASGAFEGLLAQLADEIIPALERYPEIGSDFLARAPLSTKGQVLFEKVAKLLKPGTSLRQLTVGDYLVLYMHSEQVIHLLSIRHHRQLSFDFAGHWP